MTRALAKHLAAAVLMLGCAPQTVPPPVVPFCSLPWANCLPCEGDACDGAAEQWWCCDPDGGCVPVDYALDCSPSSGGWIAYCEFGRSTPQSGPDGSGWECLE